MAEKLPYYPRYPKDYLTDENVAVMSLEEEGAYGRLMDHCWIEGSIPDDLDRLARLCRTTPEHMERLWPALRPCFDPAAEGRLDHPRLAIERRKAARKSRKLSNAGSRGAENRWGRKSVSKKIDRPDGQAIARLKPQHGKSESESESDLEPRDLRSLVRENADAPPLNGKGPDLNTRVRELHAHFNEKRGGRPLKLTADRKAKYRARLRTYSSEDLKTAIDSALDEPYYQGDNKDATRYDFPETILKNDAAVDRHLDRASRKPERTGGIMSPEEYAEHRKRRDLPSEELEAVAEKIAERAKRS